MEYNIWRAPTDNDRVIKLEWQKADYDRTIFRPYSVEVKTEENGCISITAEMGATAIFLQNSLTFTAAYTIDGAGTIHTHMDVRRDPVMPFLPRFGVRLFLKKEESREMAYLGYGPGGSYVDLHHAQQFGRYNDQVWNYEHFIKPQENNSHWGTEWLQVGRVEVTAVDRPLSFNASRYTQEQLTAVKHDHELIPEPEMAVLCIDGRMSGIGSGSCGPQLSGCYQVREERFTFDFVLELK